LTQSQNETPSLNPQTRNSPPNWEAPSGLSETFDSLRSEGANLFRTLDEQLSILETQLADSKTAINDLQSSLNNCLISLRAAQAWAAQMGERLRENNEDLALAYQNIDTLSRQNADLKLQTEKMRKQAARNGIIGFGFAGAGFGAGIPLMAEGVRDNNHAMTWAGAGTLVGTAGIWLLGHFLLEWW
jgi:hypothetical protein